MVRSLSITQLVPGRVEVGCSVQGCFRSDWGRQGPHLTKQQSVARWLVGGWCAEGSHGL